MKKLCTGLAVLGLMVAGAQADIILGWSFSGATPIVSQVANDVLNANLDSGGAYNNLTRGAGAGTSSGNSSFRTVGFQNNGISVANTDFFEIKLSAASGYTLSLSGISGTYVGTSSYFASPGVSDQWAYSTDGSTFTLIASAVQSTSLSRSHDFSGEAALQNVAAGTDVYLRYYATGQTSTGGWGFGSAGIDIDGTITVVPEPGVMALLSIGGLAVLRVARRRKS